MLKRKIHVLIIALLLSICYLLSGAAFHDAHANYSEAHNEHVSHQSHHAHKHHAGLFFGLNNNLEKESTNFSLGADYAYNLSIAEGKFALALVSDYVFAEHMELLFAGGLLFKATPAFKFMFTPGIVLEETLDHESGTGEGVHKFQSIQAEAGAQTSTEKMAVFRLGAAYDFHTTKLSVSPTLNIDFTKHATAFVFGLTLGKGF